MSFYTGYFPAASNRADFMFACAVTDPTTNDFVNFVGSLITVTLRPVSASGSTSSIPALTGTNLDNQHIVVTGDGMFEVIFRRDEMAQFPAGDLAMGITVKLSDGITYQLFAGNVPIVDGVVAI